jgi:hypothetical protein
MTDTAETAKTPPWLAIVLLLGATVVVQLWQAVAPDSWEYNIIAPKDEALQTDMQRLGAEGWEVVSARRATSSDENDKGARYELIFKRRRGWLTSLVPEPPSALPPKTR